MKDASQPNFTDIGWTLITQLFEGKKWLLGTGYMPLNYVGKAILTALPSYMGNEGSRDIA